MVCLHNTLGCSGGKDLLFCKAASFCHDQSLQGFEPGSRFPPRNWSLLGWCVAESATWHKALQRSCTTKFGCSMEKKVTPLSNPRLLWRWTGSGLQTGVSALQQRAPPSCKSPPLGKVLHPEQVEHPPPHQLNVDETWGTRWMAPQGCGIRWMVPQRPKGSYFFKSPLFYSLGDHVDPVAGEAGTGKQIHFSQWSYSWEASHGTWGL